MYTRVHVVVIATIVHVSCYFNYYIIVGGDHALASHVLQFIFLGYTGFKWPVAYFPTTEAHAAELQILVWDVINKVQGYGFQVR